MPKGCSVGRFLPPPSPTLATDLNGVALQDVCFPEPGPHHVFIIGDWGGVGVPPIPADMRSWHFPKKKRPFVVNIDDTAQQRVAYQMGERSKANNPGYILNVGDNFYWGGIDTECGMPSEAGKDGTGQWGGIYEEIYKGPGHDGKQWLGVLGNHDYGGFKFTNAWDQVIGYTWATRAPSTGRWMTPAQYWRVKVHYPDFAVDYFFVDSNFVDAAPPDSPQDSNICSVLHNPDGATCGTEGPTSPQDCTGWFHRLWEEEQRWLESGLTNSTADWQVVVTHFPPTAAAGAWSRLAALGIDLIAAGHVHNQQVVYDPLGGGFLGHTAYVVSGGGGGITSEGLPDSEGNDDQYGFMDLTFTKETLTIEAVSHGGQVRGTTVVKPRPPDSSPKQHFI